MDASAREARPDDAAAIARIWSEGIEDRRDVVIVERLLGEAAR